MGANYEPYDFSMVGPQYETNGQSIGDTNHKKHSEMMGELHNEWCGLSIEESHYLSHSPSRGNPVAIIRRAAMQLFYRFFFLGGGKKCWHGIHTAGWDV